MGFVRARTEEQITSRQGEIIAACDTLFSRHGYEGVHFKAISEMTSFKRPTIYLYYKTKDEVLLDLLKNEMLDWNAAMRAMIDNAETMTKEAFCGFLADTMAAHGKMLRLFAILCTNIENQCRLERLAEFKKEVGVVFVTLRESLEKFFPHTGADIKMSFMTALLTYMHGLYPLAYPTQKQIDAMVMAGMGYEPLDFRSSLYHGLWLLAAEL